MMKAVKNSFTVFTVLLCLSVLFVMTGTKTAYAAQGGQIGDLTWELDDEGKLTISGTGEMENYESGAPWYSERNDIKSIEIRVGVTCIGEYAFSGCSNLMEVEIPDSVSRIGDKAFLYCSSLTNVVIPEGVTNIGACAFDWCSSLESVTIPDSVTSIGAGAFSSCRSLTKVVIPEGVTSLAWGIFTDCSSLKSVTIPDSVATIGEGAFDGCSNLKSAGPIGSGCNIEIGWTKQVPVHAFYKFSGLMNVTIPEGVTSIGAEAFASCIDLVNVTIPDSVTNIGYCAFISCSSLESVTIPRGVKSIGEGALYGCHSLKKIYIPWEVCKRGNEIGVFFNEFNSVGPINSGCDIEIDWETIPDNAFAHTSVEKVIIPKSVTSIGSNAFSESALKNVTIPDSVTSIGNGAFSWCINLMAVTIPNGLSSIEDEAFEECSSLKRIIIPKNVTGIGTRAFAGCSSLASIIIVNEEAQIDNTAFENSNPTIYGFKGSTAESFAAEHKLQFKLLPSIITQPSSIYPANGKTATLKITAEGAGTLSYQWYYRPNSKTAWKAVSSVNGKKASYSFTVADKHDGYQYRCIVSNPEFGVKETSKIAKLTIVREKPVITTQPKALTVKSGDKATFKVTANGIGLSYQWSYRTSTTASWKKITSGTKAIYSVTTAAKHNGYQYKCVVTNAKGSVTSKIVKLTVVAVKPTIKTQPAAVSVKSGAKASFKVAASGTALSYQWSYRTSSTGAWKKITGATKATYSFTTAKKQNGYQYKCVVKNLMGSVTSKIVKLTVK